MTSGQDPLGRQGGANRMICKGDPLCNKLKLKATFPMDRLALFRQPDPVASRKNRIFIRTS